MIGMRASLTHRAIPQPHAPEMLMDCRADPHRHARRAPRRGPRRLDSDKMAAIIAPAWA